MLKLCLEGGNTGLMRKNCRIGMAQCPDVGCQMHSFYWTVKISVGVRYVTLTVFLNGLFVSAAFRLSTKTNSFWHFHMQQSFTHNIPGEFVVLPAYNESTCDGMYALFFFSSKAPFVSRFCNGQRIYSTRMTEQANLALPKPYAN